MGTFRYPVVIRSRDGTQTRVLEALVDTGATYGSPDLCLGPRAHLWRRLRLADGRMGREGTEAVVEDEGALLTTVVMFGDPGSEPLLGAVTIEKFSLTPDPVARRLVPVEALLM